MTDKPKPRGAVRTGPAPVRPVNHQPARRGAEQHNISAKVHRDNWLRHHRSVARQSLQRLLATPLTSLMTIAVLAIALTLPGFLLSALSNARQLTDGWYSDPRLALYLQQDLSAAEAERFSRQLMLHPQVAAVDFISAQQGLLEFRQHAGLGDALDALPDNPLPAVIMLTPVDTAASQMAGLQQTFSALPEVAEAVVDLEWLQRLQAMLALAQRSIFVLALLLGLAVLLVVGNTIKMTIQSRQDEIVVSKLVGATDAWVQRPFLYTGIWYGVCGAMLAWLMIQFAWLLLDTPVQTLGRLYNSQFELHGLEWGGSLLLLVISLLLGWGGAWLAVYRHLRRIEPH